MIFGVSVDGDSLFICKLDILSWRLEFSFIKDFISESLAMILSLKISISFNLIPIIVRHEIAICNLVKRCRFSGVSSSIELIMNILFCLIMG